MLFATAAVLSFVLAFAALALVGARLGEVESTRRLADNFVSAGNLLATAEMRRTGSHAVQPIR